MAKQPGRRKPSRKRTLQEVTSTLQDLVNNELSDASLRIKSIQSRVEEARNNRAGGNTGSPPGSTPLETKAAGQADNEQAAEENWIEALSEELIDILPEDKPPTDSTGPGITNRQQAIPDEQAASTQAKDTDRKNSEQEAARKDSAAPATSNFNDQIDMWDDDIPVLREVAAPPPTGRSVTTIDDSGGIRPLPSRERVRKLAINIIAKLNIELRQKGKPELEPLIINRLQRLLEEELEQQAANMENSGNE